ncbi:hypothetical protein [Phycicoccus ginsengisoli]
MHANAPADLPARFEALGALAGMPRDAVRAQLASALRVVVHVQRRAQGRRVASISVLRTCASSGEVRCDLAVDALSGVEGPAWPELAAELALGSGRDGPADAGADCGGSRDRGPAVPGCEGRRTEGRGSEGPGPEGLGLQGLGLQGLGPEGLGLKGRGSEGPAVPGCGAEPGVGARS